METRKDIAAEKKRCGSHNCTQAVLCTYHDFAGMEEETIKNVGNAFAAGMGNMEELAELSLEQASYSDLPPRTRQSPSRA